MGRVYLPSQQDDIVGGSLDEADGDEDVGGDEFVADTGAGVCEAASYDSVRPLVSEELVSWAHLSRCDVVGMLERCAESNSSPLRDGDRYCKTRPYHVVRLTSCKSSHRQDTAVLWRSDDLQNLSQATR